MTMTLACVLRLRMWYWWWREEIAHRIGSDPVPARGRRRGLMLRLDDPRVVVISDEASGTKYVTDRDVSGMRRTPFRKRLEKILDRIIQ